MFGTSQGDKKKDILVFKKIPRQLRALLSETDQILSLRENSEMKVDVKEETGQILSLTVNTEMKVEVNKETGQILSENFVQNRNNRSQRKNRTDNYSNRENTEVKMEVKTETEQIVFERIQQR